MAELIVKSEKGELKLRKSSQFVGLRTKETIQTADQQYVDKALVELGGFDIVTLKNTNNIDNELDTIREYNEVEVGTHVYYAEGSHSPMVPTGDIFIVFEDGVSIDEQAIIFDEFALLLVEQRTPDSALVRTTSLSPNPFKVMSRLQQLSLVKVAEADFDIPLDEYGSVILSDDLIEHQWHLKNDGRLPDSNHHIKAGADARIIDGWNRLGNAGKSNIKVAVIDNGFDISHPDLKDKIIKPYNAITRSSNMPQGDRRYTHGTPCASVAVAASNGNGIVGSAPNARLIPVHGTSFRDDTTERMFDYCIQNGADVISCSWGTTDPRHSLNYRKRAAIKKAATQGRGGKGAVIVYAAGNEQLDYINYYAAHPNVIAVAASNSQDKHAYYSNRGSGISVCAPSNGDWPIIAARAWWDEGHRSQSGQRKYWADGISRGDKYKHFGGTSSATPLVAGICALMLSANPDLTAAQVKSILEKTADKIGHSWEYDATGYSSKYGHGRVNADKAIAEAIRLYDKNITPPVAETEKDVSKGRGLFLFNVKRQAASGYGVQIGAFYEYGNVLIQVEKLQKRFGEKVVVSINELKGKTVYKVIVGVFANKNEASQLRSRMKNAGQDGFVRNLKDLV